VTSFAEDQQEGGPVTSQTAVTAYYQSLSIWRPTELNGGASLASTVHVGREFREEQE